MSVYREKKTDCLSPSKKAGLPPLCTQDLTKVPTARRKNHDNARTPGNKPTPKEQPLRQERRQRDSSASKKPKRTESIDKRPIITQEKPAASKPSRTSLKEKAKTQTEKTTADKPHKRKADVQDDSKREKKGSEKDRKPSKQTVPGPVKAKHNESLESRLERESKIDAIYVKVLQEGKASRKAEVGRGAKPREKPVKSIHEVEKMREREETKPKTRRDRTRTRTLSPTEVKQLIPPKMGFEVAAAGDPHTQLENREEEKKRKEEMEMGGGDEYEDDFEDYDSDFESESQESPMNSTFVISRAASPSPQPPKSPEAEDQWRITVRKKEIEAVKKSIEKENYALSEKRNSIKNIYEDDSDKENIAVKKPGSGLVDFSFASRKQKKSRKEAERRRRGEDLLNMISLDTISYTILEIPPVPYDDFMKAFGKSNTKQVYVQTNEDDLDEEVQTDEISMTNKWTQYPPEYLGSRKSGTETSFILTKQERLGVGGDVETEEEITIQPKMNALWNFLSWASQLVLGALEKKSGNFLTLDNMPNHSKAMAFGDGFVSLNVSEVPFLKGRSITHLSFLSTNLGRLLSVHTNKEKSFQKCMICIWSLRELSKPLKVLMASNRVSSCCFGLNQGNLVFAGLADGSVCLWDLRESSAFHNQMTNTSEWSLQSPTYTTAGSLRDDGHSSPVVAIRLLSKVETASGFGDFTPMQICSLDKEGTIIIWTVVQLAQRSTVSDDLGLAHWGRVKLVKSSSFCVFASLRDEIQGFYITCNDIIINEAEDDGFYVANSLGSVHHCSAYGSALKPKFYVPSKQDAVIETTCLELCPFNGNYFLVGCGDGSIRLHSRHQENPLICLNSNIAEDEKEASIVSLSWMRVRPCVFFALDSMSRINIWDFGVSDMYPEISLVLTQKKITCMKLLPVSSPRQVPFIVIGTEGGSIEIHKLKKEYGCRTVSDVKNEMKMFLKYVSIL